MNFRTTPCKSINDGGPPTTAEWNEWERKQAGPARRSSVASGTDGKPAPLPMLTPEQVQNQAQWLYASVVLLVEALDREKWDGRWNNRLMHAHTFARNALEDAAKYKEPSDGMALDMGATEDKEKEPDAGSDAEDASDRQAGEA